MKTMLLIVSSLITTNAFAEVYRCHLENIRDYLFVLSENRSLVYTNENGYFKELKGQVTVVRSEDGGPLWLQYKPVPPQINWDERHNECSVSGDSMFRTTILVNSINDYGSTIQYYPTTYQNPKRPDCQIIRPEMGPPTPMFCELLK